MKEERLKPYYKSLKENQLVDSLVALALMIKIHMGVKMTLLMIKKRENPSFEMIGEIEEEEELPWYSDTWNFLENREYL